MCTVGVVEMAVRDLGFHHASSSTMTYWGYVVNLDIKFLIIVIVALTAMACVNTCRQLVALSEEFSLLIQTDATAAAA